MKLRPITSCLFQGTIGYSFWCLGCESLHAFYTNKNYDEVVHTILSTNPLTVDKVITYVNSTIGVVCKVKITSGKLIYESGTNHPLASTTKLLVDIPVDIFLRN